MKFLAICLLIVPTVYCHFDTEATTKLLQSNLNCKYETERVCLEVREENYGKNLRQKVLERELNPLGADIDDEINQKISHCCNKDSNLEKKMCLKNVKKQVIVLKIRSQNTYNRDINDKDMFEMLGNQQENKYSRLFNLIENEDIEDQIQNENDDEEYDQDRFYLKSCNQDNQCRRKKDQATSIAARKACTENLVKNGRKSSETCCKAGEIVGVTVGQRNKNVCVPALLKFEQKIQGCGLNQKSQCKQAFVACCKKSSKFAKKIENLDRIQYLENETNDY